MADSEEDDQLLVDFVESSMLSDVPDQEEKEADTRPSKRLRIEEESSHQARRNLIPPRIESGVFSHVPPEVIHHILKFLSSEDLISCSIVCKFLNSAASDEGLWRRLYCMRWRLASPSSKLRACAWKNLYIQMCAGELTTTGLSSPEMQRGLEILLAPHAGMGSRLQWPHTGGAAVAWCRRAPTNLSGAGQVVCV